MITDHHITALRAARLLSGISQRELADKIGRSQIWVSRVERGARKAAPSHEDVAKLAEVLNVTPKKLFIEVDE